MEQKPITVVGGGNGGHCMAADLSLRGYQVNLYEHERFKTSFKTTIDTGAVQISGIGPKGTAKLHKVTFDMGEALCGAEIINVVIPAAGHELFFREILPHLEEGQIVVVWAGDFGSLRLAKLIGEHCPGKKIYVAEANTLPYGTRLIGPASVELLLTAPRIVIAGLPAADTEYIVSKLKTIWPALEATDNVILAALNNPNPICHPPGSLLNTGRIQYSKGDFYMYREGITEATARVIKAIYLEMANIAKTLGFDLIQYEERDFNTTCSIMGVAFQAPFDTAGVIAAIKGPKSIYDRYITEDLPFGLVPASQLGVKLEVPTPIIDAIVNIGSIVCDENFWQTGRTLDTLGLANLSKDEILAYVG